MADFKKGRLIIAWVKFAVWCVTGADEFFETKTLKVLSEILGKVAPFGVIAGQ